MRPGAVTIATLACICIAAACSRTPTRPTPAASGATDVIVRITIDGPNTVPLGQDVQLKVTALMASGASVDVTSRAVWTTSQPPRVTYRAHVTQNGGRLHVALSGAEFELDRRAQPANGFGGVVDASTASLGTRQLWA